MKRFTTLRVEKELMHKLKLEKARLVSSGALLPDATIESVVEFLLENGR